MDRPVSLAFALGALSGLVAASCQTYDFEPVLPVTLAQTRDEFLAFSTPLKPNLMLLVDRSGSMDDKLDPACTGTCPTRIGDLKAAMGTFLGSSGTVARMGLAIFPVGSALGSCQATDGAGVVVALPDAGTSDGDGGELLGQSQAIGLAIQGLTANGGTPTAASLAYLESIAGLTDPTDGRDDFVLLLTDGLPNCNTSNPNQVCGCGTPLCAPRDALCRCTQGAPDRCHFSSTCAVGCLDQDATSMRIGELKRLGVATIVVGFGAETAAGDAPRVLNAMAQAGGFPRGCPDGGNGACGTNNTCDRGTGLCVKQFYQATNKDELTADLDNILSTIVNLNACRFILRAQPADPGYLAVFVDQVSIPPGPTTWSYASGAVTFVEGSESCQRIKNASPNAPVPVEIRSVQRL